MKLFISYRRTQLKSVSRAVKALRTAGVDCFFDLEDIEALQDFPDRIRESIAGSHALLAWWSRDYQDSELCLAEFLLAWQHARRDGKDAARRIWVLNPEPRGDHIFAADLNATNFLQPPAPRGMKRWAGDIRIRLETMAAEGPLGTEGVSVTAPPLRNVPRPRDAIVGRTLTMLRVHTRLFPPQLGLAAKSWGVQIHGIGGVGKTEVAATYARGFARAYPRGVYWLNMSDVDGDAKDVESEATRVWFGAIENTWDGNPVTRDKDGSPLAPQVVRAQLARELAGEVPYLWVVDNVPPLSPVDARDRVIELWRAPTPAGRTLLTTRDTRVLDGFEGEELSVLDRSAALKLMSRFRPISESEHQSAVELVWELGAHTLALVLIGEHLRGSLSYTSALERLRGTGNVSRLEEVAKVLRPELGEKARSIVATFELSISQLSVDAQNLLGLISACAPNHPIGRTMLLEIFGGDGASDRFAVALRALLRASLVTDRSGESWVEIHPIVSEVTAALLPKEVEKHREALARALLSQITSSPIDRQSLHLFAHGINVARRLLLSWLGVELLLRIAQYARAVAKATDMSVDSRFADWALVEANWMCDNLHPIAIKALAEMAEVDMSNGNLTSGIKRLREVLERQTIALPREHPDRLATMSQLARALVATGDDEGAKQLEMRVTALTHLAAIRADPSAFKDSFEAFLAALASYNESPGVDTGKTIAEIVGGSQLLALVTIPDTDLDKGLKEIKSMVRQVMAGLGLLPDPPQS